MGAKKDAPASNGLAGAWTQKAKPHTYSSSVRGSGGLKRKSPGSSPLPGPWIGLHRQRQRCHGVLRIIGTQEPSPETKKAAKARKAKAAEIVAWRASWTP
jgi:hypothetical protein